MSTSLTYASIHKKGIHEQTHPRHLRPGFRLRPLAAPLVYTSKQVLGIDFSTPSAESPSVAFNVGFKNLDAAYIPIAVSKRSEKSEDIAITEIYATHGKGRSRDAPTQQVAPEKVQAAQNLEKATQEKIQAVSSLKAFNSDLAEYNTAVVAKKSNLAELQSSLKEQIVAPETPPAVLKKIEDKKPLDKQEQALAKAPLEQNVVKAELSAAQARQQYDQLFNDLKRDSMSVFGTFDSAFASKGEPGLTSQLGKVFSTGVAAQNLTSGFQIEQCVALMKLADENQKQQVLDICSGQLLEKTGTK